MKKRILIIFVLTFFYNINYAQSKYSLGLLLGPNYSSFRGSDFLDSTKSDFGFIAGVFVEFKLNKSFSVSTGINIEQKTITNETDYMVDNIDFNGNFVVIESINAKTNNRYQYFSVPLFLKYSFGKNKSFYLNGGPYISFLQKHKKETEFKNNNGGSIIRSSDSKVNFPLADYVSGDYGFSLGIGKIFEIDMKNKISIELRNNLGLKNTIEDIQVYGQSGVIKTNTLNLIGNWSFNL